MKDKKQLITMLRDEFNRWEELLAGLSEAQITAPQLAGDWSIKDVIGHLRAWQQVSIARMEAAQLNKEPVFPDWVQGADPDADDADQFNARIYEIYRRQPWSSVYRAWREGFLRFLELTEAIPEKDLLSTRRYPWLGEYPLGAVLEGSYEHHHIDHLEPLLAWLREHGNMKSAQ